MKNIKKILKFVKDFIDWVCYDPLQVYKDREYQEKARRAAKERRKTDRYFL